MLELDASFEEPHVVPSSVSWGFLHSISTISDTSNLQLAPSIKSYKLWFQAGALPFPVSLAGKMSASKLIWYFSSHLAASGSWSSSLPDNITSNPANEKIDHSLSDFQTDIDVAAYSTLDTEQLISIPELLLMIPLPLFRILMGEWYQSRKYSYYLLRFMIFWIMLCLKWIRNTAHI